MRSARETHLLRTLRKFARELYIERHFRPVPDPDQPPGEVEKLNKKIADLSNQIQLRDKAAKDLRLVIANNVKRIGELEKSLGRDETQKKIQFLTARISHLENSYAAECTSSRQLANEAYEAVKKREEILKELADVMVELDDANAATESARQSEQRAHEMLADVEQRYERRLAKDYANLVHKARRDVDVEIAVWKKRALDAGWNDPEAVVKEADEYRKTLREENPTWTDLQLEEVLNARRRTVGLEL